MSTSEWVFGWCLLDRELPVDISKAKTASKAGFQFQVVSTNHFDVWQSPFFHERQQLMIRLVKRIDHIWDLLRAWLGTDVDRITAYVSGRRTQHERLVAEFYPQN